MMNELDAILDGDLVSMVFLYGSAVMLIGSALLVTFLCGNGKAQPISQPLGARSYS
jgi:hypothetical protein